MDTPARPASPASPPWTDQVEHTVAGLALAGLLLWAGLRLLAHLPQEAIAWPLQGVLAVGVPWALLHTLRGLLRREGAVDLLAAVGIVTAAATHELLAAALLVLMLAGGRSLERMATQRASRLLQAIAARMPLGARRVAGDEVHEVALSDVQPGDLLELLPHAICPCDGVVEQGSTTMDESYLTGEPFLMPKVVGSSLLSGAINGDGVVRYRATRRAEDSRYARIMHVIEASERTRPPIDRLAQQVGRWFTPVALACAIGAGLWNSDVQRFLAVLVVATPCPLIIAVPVTVLGAIAQCARHGILIRDAAVLEVIGTCTTVILDKTGTLTHGTPVLAEEHLARGHEGDEVLTQAASLEQYSRHPLAQPLLEAATRRGLVLETPTSITEQPGRGCSGHTRGHLVLLTSRTQATLLDPGAVLPAATVGLECVVMLDGRYAATYTFRDEPRAESHPFVRHLQPRHGVGRVLLVSGDRRASVEHLARQVGITEIHAEQSPEQKLDLVRAATQEARTLFVGDGINDAPAMLAATVGVAIGSRHDATCEAAGAVILESSLQGVDHLIHIGYRMRTLALQSSLGGLLLGAAGMAAAAVGHLSVVEGALLQELIDLAALVNALRIALPGGTASDLPTAL